MKHTPMIQNLITLLRENGIRYRSRVTRWGNTVTVPDPAMPGTHFHVFQHGDVIGVTSTSDDVRFFIPHLSAMSAFNTIKP